MSGDRQGLYDQIPVDPDQQVARALHFQALRGNRLARGDQLTPREREIILLVGQGLTDQEVAAQLCLSVRTVQNHLHRSYTKLRVNNRIDAVEMVMRWLSAQKCEPV
jgi:RNA polymerase sigma factor (sigma-70 family)